MTTAAKVLIKPQHKNLVYNFSSLTLFQISNYIFPLITFPYLVRVLGPEKYGLISFAAAFVLYFNIITDYGFNITATKAISLNRDNKIKISEIISNIFMIKLGLFLLCTILFFLIVLSFSKFSNDLLIYVYSFYSLIGLVLLPNWVFQGLEKMKFIAIINIAVKVFWVISIFIFIKSESDYLLLVLLNSFSIILISFISLLVIYFLFKIKFVKPSYAEIKLLLFEGWYIFISTASISLYTNSNIFILGLFASNEIVGYFSAADKIRMAFQNITSSAGQVIFPYLSNLFKNGFNSAVTFIKKYIASGSVLLFSLTVVMFITAPWVIDIVLGPKYETSLPIFRILIFLPLIIFYSNALGIQIMINLGYNKEFTKVVLTAGIISIMLSFIFVPMYLEIGLAIIMLLVELIVSLGMLNFVLRKNILSIKKVELNQK
ncbi:MAG: flippase [Ignavibacteriae bacterium]|nr:flippase [Ignavibacteriota bacterium]